MKKEELKRILLIAREWFADCQKWEGKFPINEWRKNFYELRNEVLPDYFRDMNLNEQGVELLFCHLSHHIAKTEQEERERQPIWSFDSVNSNIPQIQSPTLRLIV